MAYQLEYRAGDPAFAVPEQEWEGPDCDVEIPGKQTRAEQLNRIGEPGRAAAPRPRDPGKSALIAPRLGFSDFQALALRDVLARLRHRRALHEATLQAADPGVALRVGDRPAGGRRPLVSATASQEGRGFWRAAERRAVTLYRRARAAGAVTFETPAVAAALQAIGSGVPLAPHVCQQMERILGVRLDRVRIHTGAVARDAAEAADATAFTVGEDIFFPGYDASSAACQETLLHELVHCCQWWQGRIGPSARGGAVSDPSHPLEREAEAVATNAFRRPLGCEHVGMQRSFAVGAAAGHSHRIGVGPALAGGAALSVAATPPVPTVVPSSASPHRMLRKAKLERVSTDAAPRSSIDESVRQRAMIESEDPTLALHITPGSALALERPHYGEAAARVTGRTPRRYRYLVLVAPALRDNYDAAWLFSSLPQVPAETVSALITAVRARAGLSHGDADAESTPSPLGFWLPATNDGATLYFSAAGQYVVVALADAPDDFAIWRPFVVQPRALNEFEQGVVRGIYNTGALFASGLAAMARGVGAGQVSKRLLEDVQASLQKQAETYPAKVQTIDEALTGIGPFLSYTAAALGEQVPTLITMILGGGFGRVFAGAVAKTAATHMGKSLGEHEAAQLALKASATWKYRGAFLGAFGTNAEMQTGEIYKDLTEIQGLNESQKAVLVALMGGVMGGFLETLVPFSVARMWGLGRSLTVGLAKQIAARPALAARVLRAAGIAAKGTATIVGGAGAEGLTEVAQGEIGNLAKWLFDSHFSFASAETGRDRKENFAKGFIVGGVLGGAGHAGKLATALRATASTTSTTTQSPTVFDESTVLQTVRDGSGTFRVAADARAAASIMRSGADVDSYNPTTHRIRFRDGAVIDARYVLAHSDGNDYIAVGVDPAQGIGWFRSATAQTHDVVALALGAVSFIAPFAGGAPVEARGAATGNAEPSQPQRPPQTTSATGGSNDQRNASLPRSPWMGPPNLLALPAPVDGYTSSDARGARTPRNPEVVVRDAEGNIRKVLLAGSLNDDPGLRDLDNTLVGVTDVVVHGDSDSVSLFRRIPPGGKVEARARRFELHRLRMEAKLHAIHMQLRDLPENKPFVDAMGGGDELPEELSQIYKSRLTDEVVSRLDGRTIRDNGGFEAVSPRHLAKTLFRLGVRGPIRLIACMAGAYPDGFAAKLADEWGDVVVARPGLVDFGLFPSHGWYGFAGSGSRRLLELTPTDQAQSQTYDRLVSALRKSPYRMVLVRRGHALSTLRQYGFQQSVTAVAEMLGRDVGLFVVGEGDRIKVVLQSAPPKQVAKLVPPPGTIRELYKFRPGHYSPTENPDLERDIARCVEQSVTKPVPQNGASFGGNGSRH